ncbi:MAG: hypothetical protein ACI9TH_002340 [Kiritimatiellia bacterium]|jgi:hypothetical protein
MRQLFTKSCLLFSMLFVTTSLALDVEFSVEPAVIRQNESAIATLKVNGNINPTPPNMLANIEGFDVRALRSQRTSINGRMSFTFMYQLLPRKQGDFTIGPFTYRHGREVVELPARTLKVVGVGERTGLEIEDSDLIFARLSLSNTNVYTHEFFDVDVTIYYRSLRLSGEIELVGLEVPGVNFGGWQGLRSSPEIIDGHRYSVSRFRSKAKAISAGTYELMPTVRLEILVSSQFSFFGEQKSLELVTKPVSVTIKSPPEIGRPPSYQGAVGKFSFTAEVNPLEMNEGDPITIRMVLKGKGNLDTARPPLIEDESNFKVYDVKLMEDQLTESKDAGQRIYEQVVIPRNAELTELPALVFSYFNPESGQYEKITRGPFPMTITAASNQTSRMVGPLIQGTNDKKILGDYIEHLKPLPKHWEQTHLASWLKSPVALGAQALPPLLALFCLVMGRRRESLRTDVEKARKVEAPKIARHAIKQAHQSIKENDAAGYYAAASEALNGYLANRLNLGAGEVTPATLRAKVDAERHTALLDQIEAHYETYETKRFSPVGLSGVDARELDEDLEQLTAALKACEKVKLR